MGEGLSAQHAPLTPRGGTFTTLTLPPTPQGGTFTTLTSNPSGRHLVGISLRSPPLGGTLVGISRYFLSGRHPGEVHTCGTPYVHPWYTPYGTPMVYTLGYPPWYTPRIPTVVYTLCTPVVYPMYTRGIPYVHPGIYTTLVYPPSTPPLVHHPPLSVRPLGANRVCSAGC